ncbi:MAG TPA: protein kinase [Thermoanaerobaculia bacterium]|nr:protein kinase [Thermoanaerobaculia bacterium]
MWPSSTSLTNVSPLRYPSASVHLQPGSRLGPYEVISPLGAGGMGEVYRARDERIGRDVAVKILPSSFAESEERLHRFEQEARATGMLNHPNLLTIHDFGQHDGAPYIVSELLEGETLRDRMTDASGGAGPVVPPRKAIEYAVQIANGLAAAHERGIVHRDLKPENVFVTRDGRVKILDFGLAKLAAPFEEGNTSEKTAHRDTTPGQVVGTAGYMSPEQVRGQQIDHRSDIFSFGAILYELLSGQRAFHGGSAVETMNAILKEDPPELSSASGQLAPALERIVGRCLEKAPEERFHSAHDLALALEAASGAVTLGSGAMASREGKRSRLRLSPAVTAGVVAALIIAGAAALVMRVAGYSLVRAAAGTAPRNRHVQLTFHGGEKTHVSLSPDGSSFLFVGTAAGNPDIYLQRVGGENAINLTKDSSEGDFAPAFSPDGQRIAFRSQRDGGGIYVMGATGESARRLTDFGFDPAWSPDGRKIACTTEPVSNPGGRATDSELWIVDAETGARELLYKGDAVQPDWSPSGERIAFWGLPKGTAKRILYTISASGGEPVPINDDNAINWRPIWSRDGAHLYFSSNRSGSMNLWRAPLDQRSGKAAGEPEPVTSGSDWNGWPAAARATDRIAFATASVDSNLYRVEFDPVGARAVGTPAPVTTGSRILFWGDPSPDGSEVLLWSLTPVEDILLLRTANGELRKLTDDAFRDRRPVWEAGAKTILFYSNRNGRYELWRIRPDGSGLEQVTSSTGAAFNQPMPSPGGRQVVVQGGADSHSGLIDVSLPIEQRVVEWLPKIDGKAPVNLDSWSPDGTKLIGRRASPGGGIVVYSLQTKEYEVLTESGGGARWLPDGRRILFEDDDALHVIDSVTKERREILATPPGETWTGFRFTGDGRTLYFVRQRTEGDVWMLEPEPRG